MTSTFGSLRLAQRAPFALLAALVTWAAIAAGGAVGAGLVGVSAVLGGTLVLWYRDADVVDRAVVGTVSRAGLLVLPGLLVVALAFSSGGFFPAPVAVVALGLLVLIAVRCSLAADPLAGLRGPGLVPVIALAAFAGWTILSARWSDSTSRALVEFDRALLYAAAAVLFASIGASRRRLELAVRALAAGFVVVAFFGLLSRVAPDLIDFRSPQSEGRLAYPLTYWNAMGLLCVLGGLLCLHLTASTKESVVVRVLAAGALPMLGATALLTFSRGAIGAAIAGTVAYAVLGRPRGLVQALLAVVPTTAWAISAAWDAELLASKDFRPTPEIIAQGNELGGTILICVLLAMAIRGVLVLADGPVDRLRLPDRARRPVMLATWLLVAVAAAGAVVAVDAPGEARDRWDQFVNERSVEQRAGNDTRSRLSSGANQGRMKHWEAAVEGFRAEPLHGTGAGTYASLWNEHRKGTFNVTDAHSLYAEVLGELGIVGLGLLVLAIVGFLAALLPVGRGEARPVYAAGFALVLAWALHAGLDWHWEMAAVTLPVFVLGGLAAGRRRRVAPVRGARQGPALAVGVAALALALVPGMVLASQVHLEEAVEASALQQCGDAKREADAATDALGARFEPYEVRGVCASIEQDFPAARTAFAGAVERDPRNWRMHASLAAATAATGGDPRPHVRAAARLNPRGTEQLVARFAPRNRRSWPQRGRAYLASRSYSGR